MTFKKRMAELFDRSFWRVALPLIIPIAMQNLLMTSFRLIDTLMVGRLGDVSIAAVGLAGWASFFVELLAFGMSSGAAVFVAQYHGANNKEGMLRTYGMMLLFMVPLGLVFTLGVALSALRPAGFARIDGKKVDVVTRGDMLPAGCPIVVLEVGGNRVVVGRAPVDDARTDGATAAGAP